LSKELEEIRFLLRERSLIEEPQLDIDFGSFRNEEQGLESPALFLSYDLPSMAQPWADLNDGDVLHFFFDEGGINIARIIDDRLVCSVSYTETMPNYLAFRAELTRLSKLNIVVRHSYGGCSLVVAHGITGRYRVTFHEKFGVEQLPEVAEFIEATHAKG
jgi:hypothetical protein